MKTLKKYNVWTAKSNGDPIEGSDRIITGFSKREVVAHLAYENGIEHKHNDMLVRLPDGSMIMVSEF